MKKELPVRRSHAERRTATRHAVLEAAIATLHEYGYGATTTVMVAEAAGISRGAMLNHFPTKADLMTFVVEEVFEQEIEEYRRALEGIDDPRERMLAYPEAAWKVLSRASGVAVLEIMMGSRSDPILAERLKPIQQRIDARSVKQLEGEFGRPPIADSVRLVAWAIRGLSIENVLSGGDGAAASVRMLRTLIEAALNTGLLPDATPLEKPAVNKRRSPDRARQGV